MVVFRAGTSISGAFSRGILSALLLCCAATASAEVERSLNFYVMAPRGVQAAQDGWKPITEDLQRKARLKVTLHVSKDQKEVRNALLSGDADLAYIGNVGALEALEADKADVFMDSIRVGGARGYYSLVVARRDSSVTSIDDLRAPKSGLVISLGEEKSASGYVIPSYYIWAKRGKRPEQLFSKVLRGDHQTNMLRVLKREADLATTNDSEFEVLRKSRPQIVDELKIVWKSEEIPESPLVWKRSLSPGLKKKLSEFFSTYGKSEQTERDNLMRLNSLIAFVPSNNVRLRIISDIEMFSAMTAISQNKQLTETDRQQRVDQIVQRAVRLDQKLLFVQ